MYRSKKTDDLNQGNLLLLGNELGFLWNLIVNIKTEIGKMLVYFLLIITSGDQGFSFEHGAGYTYNLSQLPMLQSFDQGPSTSLGYLQNLWLITSIYIYVKVNVYITWFSRYGGGSWIDHRRQVYRSPWRGLTARDNTRTRQTLFSSQLGERFLGVSNSILDDKNKTISFRTNSREAAHASNGIGEAVPRSHSSFLEGMKTFNKSWGQSFPSNPNPSMPSKRQDHTAVTLNFHQSDNPRVGEETENDLKRKRLLLSGDYNKSNQDLDLCLSLKVPPTHNNLGECLLEEGEKEHEDSKRLSLSLSSSSLSQHGRAIRKEDQNDHKKRKISVFASPLDLTL